MKFPRILKKKRLSDLNKTFYAKICNQGVNRATPCRQKFPPFTSLLKKF